MNSRLLQNKIILISLILSTLVLGLGVWPSHAGGPVAVFLSADEEAYKRPVEAFVDEIKLPVITYNLHADFNAAEGMMKEILSKKPSLIFAVGAKAAYGAKVGTLKNKRQDVPVVFAMVLNWERYKLLDNVENVAGVAAEVDPGTQMMNLTMFAPNVSKIGVIYSKASAQIIQKAEMVTTMLGLEMIAIPIDRPKEFRRAYEKMEDKIQALWLLSDPVVYTAENMGWVERHSYRDKIIMMGQSENIVKQGAFLAISLDRHNIGVQAASIAKNILENNQSPKGIGVMPPLGTQLILNMKTANKIGIQVSDAAKSNAFMIIE